MLKLCIYLVAIRFAFGFQCYHGVNITFVDNVITEELKQIECSADVKFCKRISGIINGKPGWIASCIYSGSDAEKNCQATNQKPDCKNVQKTGDGIFKSDYNDCCCSKENCNKDDNISTDAPASPTQSAQTEQSPTTSGGSRLQPVFALIITALLLKLGLKSSEFILLFIVLTLAKANALQCYSGSLESQNTEYAFNALSSKNCGANELFCTSTYINDGWGITITMDCADDKVCKDTDAYQIDLTNAKRSCCKTDLCNGKSITEKYVFKFPDNFHFSSATSAYQVEGAARTNGRGLSIWDTFAAKPGNIKDGSTADIACDTYHKYKEDVQLMKNMGLDQYRFSMSWSRIFPNGTNPINQEGVDYYHSLIDEIILQGITPVVTLFHWDMPQALMDQGGFLNEKIVDWFGDYARFCFSEYGSKVQWWLPLNEPLSVAQFDYCGDTHADAPGEFREHCEWSMYLAAHHMILSHARASDIYKKDFLATQKGKLGVALCGAYFIPETNSPEDVDAALRATDFAYGWFGHPIFHESHDYPWSMIYRIGNLSEKEGRAGSRLPKFTDEQKESLKDSAQFLGLNYYTSSYARNRKDPEEYNASVYKVVEHLDAGFVLSNDPKWRQIGGPGGWIYNTPHGLRGLLNYFRDNYNNISVLMTENGCMDSPGEDLHDVSRINYLRTHLTVLAAAIQDGCNIIGHTLWSLMDNFEWLDGFRTKFGAYRVDFNSPDRTRTPKDSVEFYKSVAKAKAVETL